MGGDDAGFRKDAQSHRQSPQYLRGMSLGSNDKKRRTHEGKRDYSYHRNHGESRRREHADRYFILYSPQISHKGKWQCKEIQRDTLLEVYGVYASVSIA